MTATRVPVSPEVAEIRRRTGQRLVWLGVLALALVAVVVASATSGVRIVSLDDILAAFSGDVATVERAAVASRLPRTALGLLAGMSLAVAGGTMQAVTRNPLADPGIFGVLSGASLAVVIGLSFFGLSSPYTQMLVAVVGAGGAALFVYGVGSLGRGGATPLKLALAGAATSAAFTSLVSAILLPRASVMEEFRRWQIGRIGGATTWDPVMPVLPFLIIGLLICLFSARGLNSLALGDDVATGLGENVMRTRLVASIGAVILCGVTTAVCGPIAFVGLIVPHLCRLLVGTDHRWMLPFAGLAGACLLLAADTLGRVVTPNSEIDVGIITPFLGAPFFIWIVRRQKVREL